jgi:hypothetical protein
MVKVYAHDIWDGAQNVRAPHKKTVEAIKRLGDDVKPILNTEENVDSSMIDGQGRYIPKRESQ